jgi:glucose-1-phosphatase
LKIDAVIFDIGNVLLTFDYFIAERALLAHTGRDIAPSVEDLHPHRMDHESGRSTREEFIRIVREAFSHDGTTPLYLLSNIGCIHHDHIFEEYDFFANLFQDGIYSYKAGVMKPERGIFELARTQFGIDPYRTLYIDDLEENVRGAEIVGFITHHYDPARHDLFVEHIGKLSFR